MTARKKTNRKPKSPAARKRRQAQKQSGGLNFEMLESRQLLAAITVSNATDILSPTADTSSTAALVASDGGDGISLREAIAATNNTVGEDTITFDAGVFTGGDDSVIRLTQGELLISDSLTIDGSSVVGVVITGDADDDDITVAGTHITDVSASFDRLAGAADDLLKDNSRVLDFSANLGNLTLQDLTITGGRLTEAFESGAGIRSLGDLSLTNSTVAGNSTIAGSDEVGEDGLGGGISISTGDATLTDSTVSGNSATGAGGGISSSDGNVFLANSTVSGNSTVTSDGYVAGYNRGGGIHVSNGDLSLTNSVVSGNSSGHSVGGGISSYDGDVSLSYSTVSGNSSHSGGGGISSYNGDVSLNNTTVSGNTTRHAGGGIFSSDGNLSLTNSTVSGNSVTSNFGIGGGINSRESTVLLVNSTVTANTTAYGDGGGISFQVEYSNVASLTIQNSILAGNAPSTAGRYANPDLHVRDLVYANDVIVEYSLIGDTNGSEITTTTGTGNILNTSALLSPLADNGGTTQTHALLLDSPAIDTGNIALAVDESGSLLTKDQRGENRVFETIDMGAFELQVDGNFETRSLVVTTSQDTEDPDDGLTSLREAIAFANDPAAGRGRDGDADGDGSASDAITFDPSVFTGGDNNLIRLTLGELVITQSSSIDGSLVGGVLITGDAADDDMTVGNTHITDVSASFGGTAGAPDDLLDDNSRVLNFLGPFPDRALALTGLTITGGRTTSSFYGSGSGGGIYALGDLSLSNSSVSGNSSSGSGGGIRIYSGELSLIDSDVSGNRSEINAGGIFSDSRNPSEGNVLLNNSIVSDNHSNGTGGGILIFSSYAVLSLTNSTVSGNTSTGSGGGIFTGGNSGDLLLTNSTVNDNHVVGSQGNFLGGGGIYSSFNDVTLIGSTVSGNSSTNDGGGIHARRGSVSLTDSTVSGNSSRGDGGGLISSLTEVSITNSTISSNSSGGSGGGSWSEDSRIVLLNSTLTGNTAANAGGGISMEDHFTLTTSLALYNSIVAGNEDDGTARDILTDGNVLNNLNVANSLIGDTTGSGITFATGTGNILNQAPLLGPLADNGGPTQTHALLPGSLAINVGSNALVNAAGLTTDQRTEDRIQFGTVDIGAFESDFNERNLVVTTIQDIEDPNDGFTSLREAIVISNEGSEASTITFDSNVFRAPTTIEISSQLPTITDTLTISGPGANLLTIDALGGGDNLLDGNGFRIFEVNDGDANNSVDASISGLTLTGGDNNDSGGAISNFENLVLDGVAIVGNRANFGGGVSNELAGALTLSNSTIANNEASEDGGGISTAGELAATNVTISGNTAAGNGGAIVSAGDSTGVTLSLTNVTLTNNTGNEGVHFDNSNGPTAASFNNTIIDGSITGVGNNGTTLAGGNNLFAGADPGITGTGNLFNQTSLLGPLADNGGPTLTHTLLYGSPAFNAGDSTLAVDENGNLLSTDQRGQDRILFGAIDIGAVETEFDEARSLTVTTAQDVVDASDRVTSLREAIEFAFAGFSNDGDADGDGLRADTITFDASVFTGGDNSVIRLTQGELSISDSLTIDASSVGGVVITGDAAGDDILVAGTDVTDVSASLDGIDGANLLVDNSRVFDFLDSDLFGAADVTLAGLTITGGRVTGDKKGGGVQFYSGGTLTLNQSTVSGNIATGSNADAGGIYARLSDVSLINSTVSGNIAGRDGGGIYVRSGNVSLTNSTVSGNISGAEGGGIYARLGSVSLTNSTVSGNISGGNGGGIGSSFGDFSLSNSTVSGNITSRDGGGIWFKDSTILLVNSTVTGNSASVVGGGIGFRSDSFFQEDRLTLHNSVVAGNTDNGTAPDVEAVVGTRNDLIVESSLIGDTTGSGITATSGTGNILNQAALLGPLADNGGPTLTHALLYGSPAIDAGSSTLAVDESGNLLPTDQRGEARIFNGAVDIGAVESERAFLLGDANLDGDVNFLDISPFISLIASSTFLDEADINRDGSVNFLDISPFISVLSSVGSADPFLLGDANLDGNVNFLDISPLISLLSGGDYLNEADIDRNGVVNFLDISPFISLLSLGDSAQSNLATSSLATGSFVAPAISAESVATPQAIFAEPPVSSAVSLVSVTTPEPATIASVAPTAEATTTTETLDVKQVDAAPAKVNQSIATTEPVPQAPLALVSDPLASPVDQANNLPVMDTAVAGVTPVDSFSVPVVLALPNYRSLGAHSSNLRGSESNGPLVKQRSLTGNTKNFDSSHESRDKHPSAKASAKKSFSTAADLFDAHPESLDEVFDFDLEGTFVGLIE